MSGMTSSGTVREWHSGDGWGVIDSPETPGGCWAHFSAVLVAGYRSLEAGQEVELLFDVAEQDGFSFVALEVWPSGQTPVRTPRNLGGPAYTSSLRHIRIKES